MAKLINGEWTYSCLGCHDTGVRVVWHPKSMEAVKHGVTSMLYTCAVRCTCKAGDRYKGYRQFNKDYDLEPEVGERLVDQVGKLKEWMLATSEARMAQHEWDPDEPF